MISQNLRKLKGIARETALSAVLASAAGGTAHALDRNSDGMSDVWQRYYHAEGLSPEADDDGDGMSNLQESRAGTDPLDALDTLEASIETDGGLGVLIKWEAVLGRSYLVETSTGVNEWKLDPGLRLHFDPGEPVELEEGFAISYDAYDPDTGIFRRDPNTESESSGFGVTAAVRDASPAPMKFYRIRLIEHLGGDSRLDTDSWEDWVLSTTFGDEDPDADGLSNAEEYVLGTAPYDPDTDGGGLMDGYETAAGTDPAKPDASESRKTTLPSPVGLVVYTPAGASP